MHPHESLIRTHVEGEGSPHERQEVDEHLKDCRDCREFLSFVQDFSETAKDLAEDEIAADEPHAPKSVIIAYEAGKLDAETSLHLRSHMLFCDTCAETYYLLKRMRAPSWTEVVIGIIQGAKDTLLEALEITGMGEFISVPATITKGSSEESEEGQSRIEIAQHVTDSDEQADIIFSLVPNSDDPGATVRILVGIDSPKPAWKANLLGAHAELIATAPLSEGKQQLLHSGLTPGKFVAQITKDDEILAECRLQIRSSQKHAS